MLCMSTIKLQYRTDLGNKEDIDKVEEVMLAMNANNEYHPLHPERSHSRPLSTWWFTAHSSSPYRSYLLSAVLEPAAA